jgi:NADH-quinone oxidoreductase subunit C/D
MKNLPDGAINVYAPGVILPSKKDVYGNIESLMNQFKLTFEGIQVPKGEYYSFSEAANGELGFFIVSDGSGRPYKVKCRPPCFYSLAAYSIPIHCFVAITRLFLDVYVATRYKKGANDTYISQQRY